VSTIDHARKRVAAVLEEINRLKQSEFPYPHPCDALDLLEARFQKHQSVLEKTSLTAPVSVSHNACSVSLHELYVYVPILGFILRSTNVRNAFEAYAPLLRLVRSILGADTKLIVSSEWEFAPFVYRAITGLRDFVLIGLPAPESSNPLLIPLAGHELGHSVWEHEGFSARFEKQIENGIVDQLTTNRWGEYQLLYPQAKRPDLKSDDMFVRSTWINAYTWALLQTEEIFCDLVGLRLFAESYMHAFAYLVSPGTSGQRSLRYPNIARRVSHLVKAANAMAVSVPAGFESDFVAETEPAEPATKLLVSTADAVSASLVPNLIDLTQKLADGKAVPTRNPTQVRRIRDEFQQTIVPTAELESLVDILNAGWECALYSDLWTMVPQIGLEDRGRILRDLILKSMEASEIHERLRKSP